MDKHNIDDNECNDDNDCNDSDDCNDDNDCNDNDDNDDDSDDYGTCCHSIDGYNGRIQFKDDIFHIEFTINDMMYEIYATVNDFTGYYVRYHGCACSLYERIRECIESHKNNIHAKLYEYYEITISVHDYNCDDIIRINFYEGRSYENFQIVLPLKHTRNIK